MLVLLTFYCVRSTGRYVQIATSFRCQACNSFIPSEPNSSMQMLPCKLCSGLGVSY